MLSVLLFMSSLETVEASFWDFISLFSCLSKFFEYFFSKLSAASLLVLICKTFLASTLFFNPVLLDARTTSIFVRSDASEVSVFVLAFLGKSFVLSFILLSLLTVCELFSASEDPFWFSKFKVLCSSVSCKFFVLNARTTLIFSKTLLFGRFVGSEETDIFVFEISCSLTSSELLVLFFALEVAST